jgi:hypothetical protein
VSKGEETTFKDPNDPGEDAKRAAMEKYKMLLRMKIEDEKLYQEEKAKVFRLIIGQCTTTLRNKVEAAETYSDLEANDDIAGLLELVWELIFSIEKTQYEYWAMQAAMGRLMSKQENKESLPKYIRRFEAQVEATENVWGSLVPHKLKGQLLSEQNKGRDKLLACLFLGGVDRSRYLQAIDNLSNDYLLGNVNYPEDTAAMMALLTNRRDNTGGHSGQQVDLYNDSIEVMATSFN